MPTERIPPLEWLLILCWMLRRTLPAAQGPDLYTDGLSLHHHMQDHLVACPVFPGTHLLIVGLALPPSRLIVLIALPTLTIGPPRHGMDNPVAPSRILALRHPHNTCGHLIVGPAHHIVAIVNHAQGLLVNHALLPQENTVAVTTGQTGIPPFPHHLKHLKLHLTMMRWVSSHLLNNYIDINYFFTELGEIEHATAIVEQQPLAQEEGLSAKNAVYLRYGLQEAPATYVTPGQVSRHHQVVQRLDTVFWALVHKSESAVLSERFQISLKDVMACVLAEQLDDIPGTLCDVSPASYWQFPVQSAQTRMHVARYTQVVKDTNTTWYILTAAQPGNTFETRDVEWTLAMLDPMAVNLILRSGVKTRYTAAKLLLTMGTPFKTLMPAPTNLPPPPLIPMFHQNISMALGIRLKDTVFTTADFHAYERIRDNLVQSYRGRAALLQGGIVWRLAMQSIDVNSVLLGPSLYHTTRDRLELDGESWVDDQLSPDDTDIICGVYRAYTSKYADFDITLT